MSEPAHHENSAISEDFALTDDTCAVADSADAASGQTIGEGLDALTIPVLAEVLRPRLARTTGEPVRVQRRVVREDLVFDQGGGREEIRVSRQFVTRPGVTGEPVAFEQIVIEIPLPAGVTPAELEVDGAEQIVVTHEIVQRTERVTGSVRREEVKIVGNDAVLQNSDVPDQR